MASKLNQEKEALRETYSQLLRFESILSMVSNFEQMLMDIIILSVLKKNKCIKWQKN